MSIRRFFEVVILLSIFSIFIHNTTDPDLWWHLETGEYVLENGIPTSDPNFSYTAIDNEWFMHEWLSEVILFQVYELVGLVGLSIFFSVIVSLAFSFLYYSLPGRPYIPSIVTLLSALLTTLVMNSRPQMFNVVLAIIFVALIERYKTNRLKQSILWAIIPLTILWVNLHSGFVLGFVLLGAYIVGGFLQHFFAPNSLDSNNDLDKMQIRFLTLITGVSFVASMLNPKVYKQWLYPFETTLFNDFMQMHIDEWQSIDFKSFIGTLFALFFLFGITMMLLSSKRISWTDFLIYFGSLFGALQSTRNIPIFAVVVIPIIVRYAITAVPENNIGKIMRGDQPETSLPRPLAVLNLILLLMIASLLLYRATKIWSINEDAIAQRFPVDAVEYIKSENLDEKRVYNQYNWGGYLIWHEIPSFIDGRADLFSNDFLEEGTKPYFVDEDWELVLNKYEIDYVLIATDHDLAVLLTASANWQISYVDDVASIFIRTQDVPVFG